MPKRRRQGLAIVLAAMFLSQPVLAIAPSLDSSGPSSDLLDDAPPGREPMTAAVAPDCSSDEADATDDRGRERIAEQMIEIGHAPQAARAAASRLTAADLEVLLANPQMMQAAGALSATAQANIMGILIVGGIIALGIAGSSSVMIN